MNTRYSYHIAYDRGSAPSSFVMTLNWARAGDTVVASMGHVPQGSEVVTPGWTRVASQAEVHSGSGRLWHLGADGVLSVRLVAAGPDWEASDLATVAVQAVAVHRFLVPPHQYFFTAQASEGLAAGLTPEGLAFKLLQPQAGTVPLYRCRAVHHFVSTNARCEGQTVEGVLGHIFTQPAANTLPLHRLHNPSGGHLVTITEAERSLLVAAGWRYEGVLGHVYPPGR